MESFLTALKAVTPIFLPILVGIVVKKLEWIGEVGTGELNRLCFRLFMPALLFSNIYSVDIDSLQLGPLLVFCFVGIGLEVIAGVMITPLFVKDVRRRSVIIQGLFRTNLVAMGLPLVQQLTNGRANGEMAVLIAIFVPLFVIISVVLLEGYSHEDSAWSEVALSVVKNPLIIGAIVAVLLRLLGIVLPNAVMSVVSDFSKTGATLALVLLGTSLQFSSMQANSRQMFICACFRTVILPALAILAAVLFAFGGNELICVMVVFGCPLATNIYTMTNQMGGDSAFAGELVALTSLVSCGTLFLFSFILGALGLIS